MGISLITAPTLVPITTAEAKKQVEVPDAETRHDAQLVDLVKAAVQRCQDYTGLTLLDTEYELTLERFPAEDYIEVPRPPLLSITHLKYLDPDGALTEFGAANYEVEKGEGIGRVILAHNVSWPSYRPRWNAVQLRFKAGWSSVANLPTIFKQAVRLYVGHWFENREEVITGTIAAELPEGARALLRSRRMSNLGNPEGL